MKSLAKVKERPPATAADSLHANQRRQILVRTFRVPTQTVHWTGGVCLFVEPPTPPLAKELRNCRIFCKKSPEEEEAVEFIPLGQLLNCPGGQ